MNPFASPGPIKADSPLSPWSDPDHEPYYVDVDGSYQALQHFKDEIPAIHDLTRVGVTVMVMGDAGCGKTSLMNLAVHWLTGELERAQLKSVVVDATAEGAAAESFEQRMRHVCVRVHIRTRTILESSAGEELRDHRDDPPTFYTILSDALPRDTIVMVLLPPTELLKEAIKYAGLARRKIIFFGESSDDEVRQRFVTGRRMHASAYAINLQVGPLRAGDGRRFSEARMSRQGQLLPYPELDDQAAETLVLKRLDRGMSIRELQRLLHGVYEEVSGSPAGPRRITYADLSDYAVRLVSSLL